MSHYTKIKTQFRDPELVAMALIACGYHPSRVIVSKTPLQLRDYRGILTEKTAHVLIRREHVGDLCNDLGFYCTQDEQEASLCDYARTRQDKCFNPKIKELGGHGKKFMDKMVNEYAAAALIRRAKQRGRPYERYEEKSGKIKVFVGA